MPRPITPKATVVRSEGTQTKQPVVLGRERVRVQWRLTGLSLSDLSTMAEKLGGTLSFPKGAIRFRYIDFLLYQSLNFFNLYSAINPHLLFKLSELFFNLLYFFVCSL